MDRVSLVVRRVCVVLVSALVVSFTGASFGGTSRMAISVGAGATPAAGSYPQYLGTLGGTILFGASDADGPGLWSMSGNASPVLLRRISVLAQTTFPGSPNYVAMNNRGYFIGDDGISGLQLWSTDGTAAGTAMVADLGPSGTSASPILYGMFESLLVFSKVDASGTGQMYVTDGTTTGTHALTSLTGQYWAVGNEFLVVRNKFYFSTSGASSPIGPYGQIWVSDGTAAGTTPVSNPFGSNTGVGIDALNHPHAFTLIGSSFVYLSSGLLWSVDTTTDTIGSVVQNGGIQGFGPPHFISDADLIDMDGYVLFIVTESSTQELWRSDGTPSGTFRVAVINPGPLSFDAQQFPLFQKVGSRVLFIGNDAQYGSQLWSSDGTSANTIRLTNATKPANSVFQIAIYHATIGNLAYLSISDGANTTTWSVWRTDGSPAGTRRVNGIPAIDHSEAGNTHSTGDTGTVYFVTNDPVQGTSYFNYQTATDSSTLLKSGLTSFLTDGFFFDNGTLYFSTYDAVIGDEPWVSDGTPEGTRLVANLNDSPPVATVDTANTTAGQSTTINILANDSDDEALDPSSVRIAVGPSHGTASVDPNGVVTYAPSAGFNGTDSFTYTVNDNHGAASDLATVTVTVTATVTTNSTDGGKDNGKGGGGLLDYITLLGLISLWIAQRRVSTLC